MSAEEFQVAKEILEGFWLFDFWVFVFGACMGSYCNVCIYRIPMNLSTAHPPSHCYACNQRIKWYDNIPIVSYFVLGGKCRNCQAGYSPRYMLVEVLTGFLFWLVWWKWGVSWITWVYWVMMFGLVLGTFVDFDHKILPDRVTKGGILLGLLVAPFLPELHGMEHLKGWDDNWYAFCAAVAGAGFGAGILWLVAILGEVLFKKEAMGFGDVKLLGALGALLGWKSIVFIIVVSSFLGSVIGITLILSRRKELGSEIPFGPYIAAAGIIWMFVGELAWKAYFDFFMRGGMG